MSTEIEHVVSQTTELNKVITRGFDSKGNSITEVLSIGKDGETNLTRSVTVLGEYQRRMLGVTQEAKEQTAATKELNKAKREQEKADEALIRRAKQRDAAALAAEIKRQEEAVKQLTDALVRQAQAKAALASAEPGTNTWNELNKQAQAASQAVNEARKRIQGMNVPDAVKNDMIKTAEASRSVADAQRQVALRIAQAADRQEELRRMTS